MPACFRKLSTRVKGATNFEVDLLARFRIDLIALHLPQDGQCFLGFAAIEQQLRVLQDGWCQRRMHRLSDLLELPNGPFSATGLPVALRQIPARQSTARLR